MKNKIKSILSILFVGFALILSFSCNMGIIEIEQKEEAYLSIGMEENARMVMPSLKKELITDIKLYKNSETEPLGKWDNYDSMKDAKIPMAVGEYELKLEANLGSFSLEDTKNVNIIKGENSVNFTPSPKVSFQEGVGDVKITLSYEGNGDVSQGIFQIRDIWNENYHYGQLESSSNGKLVFKATDLPCKNYYFTVQAKVGDKWATYSDSMTIIPDMTSEGEFTCKLTDAPVLPSTKVTIMNGSNKVTEKDLCANASFYDIFKSIITTEEINNLTEEGKIFYGFKDENGTEVNFVPEEDCTLYINWREAKTVTFNTNGGSNIEPGKVPSGISMTIIEPTWNTGYFYFVHSYSCEKYISKPTKAGFIFDGWFLDEELTKPASCSDWSKYFDVTGDFTVYAKWAEGDKISFETNGGSDISEIIVKKGSTISINIYNKSIAILGKWINNPTKENYEFAGWYLDSGFTTPLVDGYTTNESVTLYAKWAEGDKISFETNGGSDISEIIVKKGSTISINIYNKSIAILGKWINNPTKENYEFAGWYLDSGFTTPLVDGYTTNESVTLYAKWAVPCVITFELDGGEGSIEPYSFRPGDKICFKIDVDNSEFRINNSAGGGNYIREIPTKAGYKFAGWYLDREYTESMNNLANVRTLTEATTVYAKWVEDNSQTYTITFNVDGKTYTTKDVTVGWKYLTNDPTPIKEGYIFDGWYLDSECTKSVTYYYYATFIDSNITVYAKWAEPCTITFKTNCEQTVESVEVPYGKIICLNSSDSGYFYVNTENTRGGYATLSSRFLPENDSYVFEGWYKDEDCTETMMGYEGYTVITSDITVYAKWATPYKISFDVNGGDDIEIEPIEVVPGDSGFFMPQYDGFVFNSKKLGWIQRDNPTKDGYCLGGWTNQDGSITYDNRDSILEVNNDVTVYAKWVKPCTITFETKCDQTIDPVVVPSGKRVCFIHHNEDMYFYVYADNGQGGYAPLAAVTIPENGSFVFEGWYRDEACTETMMKYEGYLEITSDITVYAKWE